MESRLQLIMHFRVLVGGPSIMHNEIRDITVQLLNEVCSDVGIEPSLQRLNGKRFSYRTVNSEDGARLDVVAGGFWNNR